MLSITCGRFLVFFIFIFGIVCCSRRHEPEIILYSDVDTTSFAKGDTVFPFSYLNPHEKGWKVVIEISGDDMDHVATPMKGRKFSTSKPQVLKLIRAWRFVYGGGDLSTVTSSVLVYHKGTLVDQQGIVLEKDQVGLQSIKYGWITPIHCDDVYKAIALMDEKVF